MPKFLSNWLKIYQDEIGLFLWSTLLLFLIRSSDIFFNNFAETAFLKRFGVEYLPIVYMVNSVSTFFILGIMAGVMAQLPGSRLLTYLLLFCGSTVAGLRFVIPAGFDLLYPLLFILKTQYEIMLGLVFWNLANDLFNTRQSKRLFPLITAGGVLGGIISSFGTPFLARAISLDNLMFVYLIVTGSGAMAVKRMGSRFPTLLFTDKKAAGGKTSTSVLMEWRKVLPLMRESTLIKILVILTLLPNVVIPIINYQFNFAVDQTFATEGGMIRFFGYFRGVLNIISLIILMFVGRIYGRWGLPVALMFHPCNYMLAFIAFLLRFDIFSAMYARISTDVLRTTINNPARAVLVGLVPKSNNAVIRTFLRGTVVRIGILIGSGLIMISEKMSVHPRYLSITAASFVGVWMSATFFLRRVYAQMLTDLISRNMLDLKSIEDKDLAEVFGDKKARSQLYQAFLSSRGRDCLWVARLLKTLQSDDLDSHILSVIKKQDDKTRIELLSLLSPHAGEKAIQGLRELADPEKPDLMIAIVTAANRLPAWLTTDFNKEVYETSPYPEVKAYAVIGLYPHEPQKYQEVIDSWLRSEDLEERKAGVIAAGASRENSYLYKLREMLVKEVDDSILALILSGLKHLEASDVNDLAFPFLSHPVKTVRLAALEALEINDDNALRRVIITLGDPANPVRELAKTKLETSPFQNPQLLVESLNVPSRKVREGIFQLLEILNIKDLDIFRFARSQLEKGYRYLSEEEGLRLLPESRGRDLLIDHLAQKRTVQMENILRVLAAQDRSGKMRIIWRGISSANPRERSNSLEALDDLMDPSLSAIMMPLLEDLSVSQCLAIGRRNFELPKFDGNKNTLYSHFLTQQDWVTVALTLYLAASQDVKELDKGKLETLAKSENSHIRQMVHCIRDLEHCNIAEREDNMDTEISIPDKIFHLKGIYIFEGLSVSELAAVASVTEVVVYPQGEVVIREGEPGDTMYLVIDGEVSVIKGHGKDQEIELDRIGAGDYFGEMALFKGHVRSATIRTARQSRLLVLHKREIDEIVREYPQIALHICEVLSQRIRELHQKIQTYNR
jgi:hypothetical protein